LPLASAWFGKSRPAPASWLYTASKPSTLLDATMSLDDAVPLAELDQPEP